MNKQQARINEAKRLLDARYRSTPYDPRFNIHNDLLHELAKCKLLYILKTENREAYAEAIFKGGGRADVFIPGEYVIYEVLNSEQLRDAEIKKSYYPEETEIIFLQASDIMEDGFVI